MRTPPWLVVLRTPRWIGLTTTLVLVAAAIVVPLATGWDVHDGTDRFDGIAPIHALWDPRVGPGSVAALLLALAGLRWGHDLAARLRWRHLMALAFLAALLWLLSLALVDGSSGISRILDRSDEYLHTARQVTDIHALLQTYVSRIPLTAPHNWPTHVAGHPPGMVLFFVGLVRLGLGSGMAAGLVVTGLAATLPLAVLTTLRSIGREETARTVAPYLVFTPAALFLAVSADAVMAVVVAWSMAALAAAAVRRPAKGWLYAVVAGLGFGTAVMMSYGLPLAAVLAVALLLAVRRWWPIPVVAVVALAVVLAFAIGGFAWWEAYPVLSDRYWAGVAAVRPASYWLWGDLAALAISAGPVIGGGLAAAWDRRRDDRVIALLVGAAALIIVAADLSRMSKAEVERIWLPFIPWLTLSVVLLPKRWQRPALAAQLLTALLVQHLFFTSW